MTALDIIDQVPEFAELVALELRRILVPKEDAISTNEAHRIYGRSWIETRTKRGELKPKMRGNRKQYSRSECERVLAKEGVEKRLLVK